MSCYNHHLHIRIPAALYDVASKVCKKCGDTKAETMYYIGKGGRRDGVCKTCRCTAARIRQAAKPKMFRPCVRSEADMTKEIAEHFLSYNKDTGEFTRKQNASNRKAGYVSGDSGYLMLSVGGREFRAHRLAWLMTYGEFPEDGLVIDHINRIRADNRICNLRAVSQKLNAHNICRPKRQNSTGFLGVRKFKKRFTARIYDLDGREMQIGTYDTPEEASAAYWATKKKLYPEAVIA